MRDLVDLTAAGSALNPVDARSRPGDIRLDARTMPGIKPVSRASARAPAIISKTAAPVSLTPRSTKYGRYSRDN